jgi:hypothetical protein
MLKKTVDVVNNQQGFASLPYQMLLRAETHLCGT